MTTSPQSDSNYKVVVGSVVSEAGSHEIDPTASAAEFAGISPVDTTAPRLLQAVATGYDEVVLTFSEPVAALASDVLSYSISPSIAVLGAVPNEWGTQVSLRTLPITAGVSYMVEVESVADRSGNVIDPQHNSAPYNIPADETEKPRVVSAVSIDSTKVLVTFSEPMSDNAGDPSNYSISPGLFVTGAKLSQFNTQVTLTTSIQSVGPGYELTVRNLTDTVGNPIDPLAATANFALTSANAGDADYAKLDPRVVGAIANSNTMVMVTFNKPMGESAGEPANYKITGPETSFLLVHEARRTNDGLQVRLETSSQADYNYTLQVVGVKDIHGNSIPAPDGIFAPPTGFDPSKTQFRGYAPDSVDTHTDSDGDGFADWFETAGWEIIIRLANGGTRKAFVTSDPYNPDTDGDGFDDGDENAHSWDPRTDDTDADQLTDGDEFNLWFSDPADQDSDNDGIDDLTEVTFFRTSPILDDTDGDGFGDDQELFEVNRDPRIANLPVPTITTGTIRLQIDERYTFVDASGETQSEESSSSVNMQQTQRTSQNRTDTSATQTIYEAGADAEIGGEYGGPGARGGVFLFRPHFQWSQGTEDTTQTSTESAQESSQTYESSLTKGREFTASQEITREVVGARIDTSLTLSNGSDVAFTISNMQLSVLQLGIDRSRFVPVATLVPGSELITGEDLAINLGPLDPERGPIIFTSTDVSPNLVEDLMRAPRGLIVKLANLDIVDEFGRNLAFVGQEVIEKPPTSPWTTVTEPWIGSRSRSMAAWTSTSSFRAAVITIQTCSAGRMRNARPPATAPVDARTTMPSSARLTTSAVPRAHANWTLRVRMIWKALAQ